MTAASYIAWQARSALAEPRPCIPPGIAEDSTHPLFLSAALSLTRCTPRHRQAAFEGASYGSCPRYRETACDHEKPQEV